MDYLGLLSLGGFVGAVVTYGLRFVEGFKVFTQAVATILAAALSGTAIAFLDRFTEHTKALGAYSVGLVIALMWAYSKVAVDNLRSEHKSIRILGVLHLAGMMLATGAALALVLPRAFRDAWGA
jgi:hypothetical protein